MEAIFCSKPQSIHGQLTINLVAGMSIVATGASLSIREVLFILIFYFLNEPFSSSYFLPIIFLTISFNLPSFEPLWVGKAVSLNRPWFNRLPRLRGGQHQNFLFGSEFPLIYWLEKHGYDVSYASSYDIERMHSQNQIGDRYKVLLSVGHDEYWTGSMRRAYEKSREQGVHLAFLSGNELFWKVRLANFVTADSLPLNRSGSRNNAHTTAEYIEPRLIICHKESIDGGLPLSSTELYGVPSEDAWTGTFIDARHRRAHPSSLLTGSTFMVNGPRHDAMIISRHYCRYRLWRNTTLCLLQREEKEGKQEGKDHRTPKGILGYEFNGVADKCSRPAGLLSMSDTRFHISAMLVGSFASF
jgi:hypothetical protein